MTRDIRSLVRGDQSRPHLVVAFARRHGLAPFLTRSARPGGKWGHTAFWDEQRKVFNEALMFKGVVETPQDKWFDRYSSFDLVAVPCPAPHKGVEFARGTLGCGYDYSGAWSVLYRGDWQNSNRWYCSERETMLLQNAEQRLFAAPGSGIHPHDLWRVVAAFAQ